MQVPWGLCVEKMVQNVPPGVVPHPCFRFLLPCSPSLTHCPLSLTDLKSSENPLRKRESKPSPWAPSSPRIGWVGSEKLWTVWRPEAVFPAGAYGAPRAGTDRHRWSGSGLGARGRRSHPWSLSCLVISSLSPCRPSPPPPQPPFCHLSMAPLGQQPNPKLQREHRRGSPQVSLLRGQAGRWGPWGAREGGNLAGEAGDGGVRVYQSCPTAFLFNTHVSNELSVKPLIN